MMIETKRRVAKGLQLGLVVGVLVGLSGLIQTAWLADPIPALAQTVTVDSTQSPLVVNAAADLADLTPTDGQSVIIKTGAEKGLWYYDKDSSTATGVSVLNGPGSVGRFLVINNDAGSVAAATAITAAEITDDSLLELQTFDGSTAKSLTLEELKKTGVQVYNVKQYGATGDGVADDTAEIQAALDDGQFGVVFFPPGTYGISSSLEIKTATRIVGCGWHEQGSQIKMLSEPASVPTYTGSTTYTPTFDYSPILYNKSGIQWFSIENLYLNGNDLDVYGLRLQENFYGTIKNVRISNCDQYAYINVRGQAINHENIALYDDAKGCLLFATTSMTFDQCGFEGIAGNYAVEMRSPTSTKSGVSFIECWFEGGVLGNPAVAHLAVSGRACQVIGGYFNATSACNAIRGTGTADALTFDGISTANAIGSLGGRFSGINLDGSATTLNFDADSKSNSVDGVFGIGNVTDAGTGNSFRALGQASLEFPFVTGRFQVRNVDATVANAVFDADNVNNTIYLLKNQNNKLVLNSGILEFYSNAGMRLRSGSSLALMSATGQNVIIGDSGLASDYADGHIVLGAYHIWADSNGVLRIKSSAPSSATDGAAIVAETLEASVAGSGDPNVLAASETHKLLTNEGTTAANYHTLPTAVAGLTYTFAIPDTDGMRITAATGDTIRLGANVTATAGYVESTSQGGYLTVTAINATEWIGLAYGSWTNGTWTYEVLDTP